MAEGDGLQLASGKASGADLSSTTALIAAVTGRVLSVKRVVASNSTTLAAQTLTIEDSAGADAFILYLAANSTVTVEFSPGTVTLASGTGLNALASTSNVMSVIAEAWVLNETI